MLWFLFLSAACLRENLIPLHSAVSVITFSFFVSLLTFHVSYILSLFADTVKQTADETNVEDNNGTKEKEDMPADADVADTGQLQETSDHKDEDDEDTDVGSPQVSAVAQFSTLMEVAEECADSSKQDAVGKPPKQIG